MSIGIGQRNVGNIEAATAVLDKREVKMMFMRPCWCWIYIKT